MFGLLVRRIPTRPHQLQNEPALNTHKLPAIDSAVNLSTDMYNTSIGVLEPKAVWCHPKFNHKQYADFCVRVL